MGAITTGLTIVEVVKLIMNLGMAWGKSQGMSEEELETVHQKVKAEFVKNDPELLRKLIKETKRNGLQ